MLKLKPAEQNNRRERMQMTTETKSSRVPTILHNTAPSKELTWEEQVLFRRNGKILKGWGYMLWTDPELDELMEEDFSDLFGKYIKIKSGIIKSDIGRYAALHKYGGVYADTDYKFLKYPSELLESACTLPTEQGEPPRAGHTSADPSFRLGNACLASAPQHPFWLDFMTSILDNNTLTDLHEKNPIMTTGPAAMTDFLLRNLGRYNDLSIPGRVKYLPDLTWSRMGIAKSRESVGIHMCWGSWRNRQLLHRLRTVARRKLTCLI